MTPILTGHVGRIELQPADYADVTTAGTPRARVGKLCTAGVDDRMSTVGVFACEPCTIVSPLKTDETILVLEGEVRIELDDGGAVELGVGDIAVLPRGAVATWIVKTPFKELFVLSGA